jgi:hypothetical protein
VVSDPVERRAGAAAEWVRRAAISDPVVVEARPVERRAGAAAKWVRRAGAPEGGRNKRPSRTTRRGCRRMGAAGSDRRSSRFGGAASRTTRWSCRKMGAAGSGQRSSRCGGAADCVAHVLDVERRRWGGAPEGGRGKRPSRTARWSCRRMGAAGSDQRPSRCGGATSRTTRWGCRRMGAAGSDQRSSRCGGAASRTTHWSCRKMGAAGSGQRSRRCGGAADRVAHVLDVERRRWGGAPEGGRGKRPGRCEGAASRTRWRGVLVLR